MSIKSLQAFPFCEMASFLFLGKGGAQPVVWSTLVHCPTVALKTNWVKIHWCRVFQSVPTRGENKCDKWARLNLHSRLITLQKQLARRTVLRAMDGETETGNAVEMGLASKSTHIPFPLSCMNPPQSWAVSGLFGGRQQSKPRYGRKWQNTMQDNFVSDLAKNIARIVQVTVWLIVIHYSSMSWFKFRNLSVIVNCVTKSLVSSL